MLALLLLTACSGLATDGSDNSKEEANQASTPTNNRYESENEPDEEDTKEDKTKEKVEESNIDWYLAQDSDFEWNGTGFGHYRYVGDEEYVEIPHEIEGEPVTSYYYMFNKQRVGDDPYEAATVKGVKSTNKNVDNMEGMFLYNGASELELSELDTSGVRNMAWMFANTSAEKLDLSNFDTSNVEIIDHMFTFSSAKEIDFSSFDTSKVAKMEHVFSQSSFDTSNLMYADSMFADAAVKELDLSHFDTSKIRTMNSMFSGTELDLLDLSSFDTFRVLEMNYLFSEARIKKAYAGSEEEAERFHRAIVSAMPAEVFSFEVKPIDN